MEKKKEKLERPKKKRRENHDVLYDQFDGKRSARGVARELSPRVAQEKTSASGFQQ